jgi:hypothetical protein
MPTAFAGAPFPFKIVLGIEVAVLPAALAASTEFAVIERAKARRIDKWLRFTGDLQVLGISPV